jgi:IS30 family transposase
LSKVKVLTQCLSGVSRLLMAKNDYRGRIPNRIDIDERPSIVDARTRIGDWELTWLLVKDTKVALPLRLGKVSVTVKIFC